MSVDWKVAAGVVVFVAFGIAGQLVLSSAMRQMPPLAGPSPGEVARFFRYVVTTPAVLLGTALLAVNFSMLLTLLSMADVTVVVPSSALSYVLLTLLARWVLHEEIPPQRWLGVLLVTIGVSLVLTSGSANGKLRSNRPLDRSSPPTAEAPTP